MHRIKCPNCGHNLKYGDEHVGKKAKCQKCGNAFVLPQIPRLTEALPPLIPGHPEIKELVPILCEHCSEPYKVHGGMGAMIRCDKCQKTACVAVLDTRKLPGPHGPGESGCVPGFRGDPAHYRAAYEAGSRAKARRRQLLDEGVLPQLLLAKMLRGHFGVNGEFEGGLKLAGANLRGALFFYESKPFESADFRDATLDESTWVGMSLSGARFDGASLRGCSIGGHSELSGASFRNADLANSEMTLDAYGRVGRIDFTNANLEGATLEMSSLFGDATLIFTNARMKGCKVSESLLPMLSERQRAEVQVMVPEVALTPEEETMAADRDRRFRSVPIVGTKSQTHSFGENAGSVTATETTYGIADASEHVLEGHLRRHLVNCVCPLAGLAVLGLAVAAVGYVGFGWPLGWLFFLPSVAGLAGAIGCLAENSISRRLYYQQARKDRGWRAGEKRPNLHIVFEHEWRRFTSSLR